ncbi:facilitated trehalose transporter Tret1-like [Anthonomus grandis grandis]|uniref:facilitated trehalose transporter Tret1-like n=1 Tax=Anthonomus grandis grandis TaxID=2921223 RepID=UPI0021656FE8|nr:facilitated trehalose transporter Tret1-like [Anthonomus grandis grandis]
MTRPVLVTENSRSALMTATGIAPPETLPQFVAAFVATLSAVCMGMVFSWTASALPRLETEFHISDSQGAWIGSLVTLGAFIGAIPTGSIVHHIGRKRTLQILILPLLISWILIAYYYHCIPVVYFARFIAGLSAGGISVAAPMYVSELAHISIRGTLGTFFQVQITVGLLIGYLFGGIITDLRLLSLVSSILPLIFLLSFAFIPESPVYLCEISNMEDAAKNLVWFRGQTYDVDDELLKITEDIKESRKVKAKISDLVKTKATFKGLIVGFGLMIFQQLSGINAVLFYTNYIFDRSGGSLSPKHCTIVVGLVQVIATLGSTVLIEKAGRKMLLVLSDLIMCISLAALGVYFYLDTFTDVTAYSFVPLISVALFIIFFSIGFGPIPWMIMAEIFTPKVKGIASSLAASLNWFLAFMVTNQFATMLDFFGIGPTFLIFSVICGLGTAFVLLFVPETKGRTIEEVQAIMLGVQAEKNLVNEKTNKMSTFV